MQPAAQISATAPTTLAIVEVGTPSPTAIWPAAGPPVAAIR
jgi:hypothetical protein